MTNAFNLLDEPWVPVRFTGRSEVHDVGLLELFEKSKQITMLAETSPPNLIALYRLLLAITHRALTRAYGVWKDADRAQWYRDGLPVDALHEYLEQERERFWMFHPESPFMQVSVLEKATETRDKFKPWTQVSLTSANGNAPVVFDHSYDPRPTLISPAVALRTLLGFLQFTPGGLVKAIRDSDNAGPLANTAATLAIGETLQETICLALHPAAKVDVEDLPTWEKPLVQIADLRAKPSMATGANDRYTRLSRAVLFKLESDESGVRWIRFAAGVALQDNPNAPDPMANYSTGGDKLIRMTFREGRAVWRDLPALVPDASGKDAQQAPTLGWAASLHEVNGNWGVFQQILIAGLASDQAKLLRWRAEQFALPAALLVHFGPAEQLRRCVQDCEKLYRDVRGVAVRMIARTMPDSASKETRNHARAIFDNGSSTLVFFATAERALPRLIALIAEEAYEDAHRIWIRALVDAAQYAWDAACGELGQSPTAWCAEAQAYPRLYMLLRQSRPKVNNTNSVLEEAPI